MLAHLVAQLLLSALIPIAHSLIFSAPERCGGKHIVTHASAFFGPHPGDSQVRDIPLFAPRAQADAAYIRRVHAIESKRPMSIHQREETGALARCLRNVRHVVGKVAKRLSQHDADLEVAREKDLESLVEKVTIDGGTAVSIAGDIVEHEKPLNDNITMPFELYNACRKLSVPRDIQMIKGKVAVVARGVCDFAQKVLTMQSAGAVGVVVVNGKDEKQLANMKLNDTKETPTPIVIPAVMISYDDWLEIMPCRNDTDVVFTTQGEATFDMDYGREALNWAMMRGMALWILCQCGVNVVRYKRRVSEFRARADTIAALPVDTYMRPSRHNASSETESAELLQNSQTTTHAPSVPGPASASSVQNHDPEHMLLMSSEEDTVSASAIENESTPLSSSTAVEEEVETEGEEPVCAICLEEFETGQQVRRLACSHMYHRWCIDPWLQSSSNSCPLCKREVPNLPPPPTQLHYGSMNV